jgi:STE24 endopeptidase
MKNNTTVPELYKEFITEERFLKSKEYSTTKFHFNNISNCITVIIFLATIYSGLLNLVDVFFTSLIHSELVRGLIFYGLVYIASTIISLPFSYYSHFVIEEKYGFNRQTVKVWLLDMVKGILLFLILVIPLLFAMLYFVDNTGAYWWFYLWLLCFVYGLFISVLYPVFIAPLFNKFTPLPEGSLRTKLEELAKQANFPMANVYIMDATKRSSHSNAYFTGFGKTKRLVLFDSMLEDFSENELACVVAHEIGHYKKHHIIKQLLLSQIFTLIMFYIVSLIIHRPELFETFRVQNISTYMGLYLISILISLVDDYFSPLTNFFSWKYETEADAYSIKMTQDKESFKNMLVKLEEKNLSNITPHPLFARVYYSHPPTALRIQNAFKVQL